MLKTFPKWFQEFWTWARLRQSFILSSLQDSFVLFPRIFFTKTEGERRNHEVNIFAVGQKKFHVFIAVVGGRLSKSQEGKEEETSETEDPMGLIVQLDPLQLCYLSSKGNGKRKSCVTRWFFCLFHCVLQTTEIQSPCGLSRARIKPTWSQTQAFFLRTFT